MYLWILEEFINEIVITVIGQSGMTFKIRVKEHVSCINVISIEMVSLKIKLIITYIWCK